MATWEAQGRYPGIYRDAEDPKHWRIVVNLGRAGKGEPRQRKVRVIGNATLTDARNLQTQLQSLKVAAVLKPRKGKPPLTVGEWMTRWLEDYKRRRVERSTFTRYEDFNRLYIMPTLGDVKLADLDEGGVQRFYNALSDQGLAPNTIIQAAALLRQALKRAVKDHWIDHNPAADTDDRPRAKRTKVTIPTQEQIGALLKLMRSDDAAVYPIVRFALASGVREGEIIGLEWSSVDLTRGLVHVRRSAARVRVKHGDVSFYETEFKGPKTEESERVVDLDDDTVAWLKEHRKRMRELKMQMRDHWTDADGDLVFPCLYAFAYAPAGRAWQAGTLRKAMQRYTSQVKGLEKLRVHDLRHAYASRLLERGVPLFDVSRMLGHRMIKTTADTYGHISDAHRHEAAQVLKGTWGDG